MDLETLLKLAGVQQSQSQCGCEDTPCGCSDTHEPTGMSKFMAMVSPELLGKQQPAMEADDEWGNAPDGAAGPAEYEDGISNLGSTSDTSLRRYLKARGANVTVDEQVYPDLTVESVAESYAAYTAEKAKNPYAIGMAAAMKSAGDKPPLKKSTITKAHEIAKGMDESEVSDTSGESRKIANRLKGISISSKTEEVELDEAQSMSDALKNALSKPEPGSKLHRNIQAHNNSIKYGSKLGDDNHNLMTKAPSGHRFDKKGMIRLGEEAELDENLGKASKKMKSMFNTDPRDVKQRIKDASPEFRDQIRNTPGKLGGPAELQRRLARKMKEEAEIDEAGGIGGGMSGTTFSNAADYAPAVGAGVRGAVNNFTMGGGKYARAAADYGVKNLGALLGMSEPTTFDTELDQELEKDIAAQRDYPLAYDIGDKAATVAQLASGAGALKVLGTSALKAAARGVDDSVVKAAQQAFAKNADANDFELGMRNAFDLTPQMRVPASPLKLTPQMRVPNKESVTESINILKTLAGIK